MANKVFELLGEIIINYSKDEIDKATRDAEKLKEELEGIETRADEAGEALGSTGETGSSALGKDSKLGSATIWLGNAMYDITLKAMNLGKQLISAGMEYNAAMEGYEVNFTTLLNGDAERAKQLIKDLEALAAETPLDMQQTAKAAQDLLIYGTAVDDVIDTIKMMGDITLGNTEHMARFALAYNQMLGKGQLMAQEQHQMTEAAVPITKIMQEHLGITQEAYESLREEGLLTAQMVKEALFAATQEGGNFCGAMERTMGTYQGQTQRAAEAGNKTAGKLFEPFFEVYKSDVLPQLTQTLANIYTWAEANQDTLRGFAESLGKIANFALSPDWDSFMDATLTTWTNTIKPALEKVLSLTIGVEVEFPKAGNLIDQFNQWIVDIVPFLPDEAQSLFKYGGKSFKELYDEYSKAKQSGLGAGSSKDTDYLTLGDLITGANNAEGVEQEDGSTVYYTPGHAISGVSDEPVNFVGLNPSWDILGTSGAYSQWITPGGGGGRPSADNAAWYEAAYYGANENLAHTISQLNSTTDKNAGQIVSLLTAILAATNRPIYLDTGALVGGMSTQMNARLGRDYAQSVRRW